MIFRFFYFLPLFYNFRKKRAPAAPILFLQKSGAAKPPRKKLHYLRALFFLRIRIKVTTPPAMSTAPIGTNSAAHCHVQPPSAVVSSVVSSVS